MALLRAYGSVFRVWRLGFGVLGVLGLGVKGLGLYFRRRSYLLIFILLLRIPKSFCCRLCSQGKP